MQSRRPVETGGWSSNEHLPIIRRPVFTNPFITITTCIRRTQVLLIVVHTQEYFSPIPVEPHRQCRVDLSACMAPTKKARNDGMGVASRSPCLYSHLFHKKRGFMSQTQTLLVFRQHAETAREASCEICQPSRHLTNQCAIARPSEAVASCIFD